MNTYSEEYPQTTASEICSFTWTALFDNLWGKLVPTLQLLYHNLPFRQSPFTTEAVERWCSAKKMFLQILVKFTRKHLHQSLIFLVQMFSCEFREISQNTFFKEPFGHLRLHKHSFCLTTTFHLFENDVTRIFRQRIFSA